MRQPGQIKLFDRDFQYMVCKKFPNEFNLARFRSSLSFLNSIAFCLILDIRGNFSQWINIWMLYCSMSNFRSPKPPDVCQPFSKKLSSDTVRPSKAKFQFEPPWEGRTKLYIDGPSHMTDAPVYIQNLKMFFSRTKIPIIWKVCIQHEGLKLYKVL